MRKAIILGAAVAVAGVLTAVALAANGATSRRSVTETSPSRTTRRRSSSSPASTRASTRTPIPSRSRRSGSTWSPTGDVVGGAPRFSIALDTDGIKKTTESYAFLDAANCGGDVGDNATFAETTIDTALTNCKVILNTSPAAPYDNWAALVAAHPSWQTSKDASFVIADAPGDYHVKDISLYKLS